MFEKLNHLADLPALHSIVEANLAAIELLPGNLELSVESLPNWDNLFALAALPDTASRVAFGILFEKEQADRAPEEYEWEHSALSLLTNLANDFSNIPAQKSTLGFFHAQSNSWETLTDFGNEYSYVEIRTENFGSIHLVIKASILGGTDEAGLLLNSEGVYDLSHVRLPFLDLFLPKIFPFENKPVYIEHNLFSVDKPGVNLPAFCLIEKDKFSTYIGGRFTNRELGITFFKFMGAFLLRIYKKFGFSAKLSKTCEKYNQNQPHLGFKIKLIESNGVNEQIILYIPLNMALYISRGVLPGLQLDQSAWTVNKITSLALHVSTLGKEVIMRAITNEFLKSPMAAYFNHQPVFRYFLHTVSLAESRRILQKLITFLGGEKVFMGFCCFFQRKLYDAEKEEEHNYLLITMSDFAFLTEGVFNQENLGGDKTTEAINQLKTELDDSPEGIARLFVDKPDQGVQSNEEIMSFLYEQYVSDKIEYSKQAADYLSWLYYDIPEKAHKQKFSQLLESGHVLGLEKENPGILKEYFKKKGLMADEIVQLFVFIHENEDMSSILKEIVPESRFADFIKEVQYQQTLIEQKRGSYQKAIKAFEEYKEFATEYL